MFQLEDYVLNYLLDFETKHSETLLNVAKLDSPFDYKLHRHGKDEPMRWICRRRSLSHRLARHVAPRV